MARRRTALSSTCSEESRVRRERVLSVDDHPLLRGGIAALVGNQTDMEVIAEACNGREALEQFRKHHPDITLMDLQMPVTGSEGPDPRGRDRRQTRHHRSVVGKASLERGK